MLILEGLARAIRQEKASKRLLLLFFLAVLQLMGSQLPGSGIEPSPQQ